MTVAAPQATNPARSAARGLIALVVLGLVGLAFFPGIVGEVPSVARELWSVVGVRRVESHAAEIRAAAAESGVDPCLLAAVMYAESRGRADAVSERGALGAFQLMPSAAGDAARKLGLSEPSREVLLTDVQLGARLAASHIAWLVQSEGDDLEHVLVAYNAGRTKVQRWARAAGGYEAWRDDPSRSEGSGALAYARSVLAMRDRFRERGEIAPATSPLGAAGGHQSTGLPE